MATSTIWMLMSALCCAHEAHDAPAKMDDVTRHQATVVPDRILLSWDGNPAFTQNVTWRTSTKVARAFVEFAVATRGPYFAQNKLRMDATTTAFESDLGTYHLHTAKMAALVPGTKYAYRVGDGNNWSEWFHFVTARDESAPFSFIYFGDAQNDIRSMWSRILRQAQSDAPKAAFMLHAGDLINNAHHDAQWGEWFAAGHWLNAMIPSIATPGNHEYFKEEVDGKEVSTLTKHWGPTFAFPRNGPEGLEESVYWLDYQGVRLISLNSNEQQATQVEWLKKVLAANANQWTIVTFHHPLYSAATGRDNNELRDLWKPVLDAHRVDLVLQGHDHTYGRTGFDLPTNLQSGMNVRRGPTVYVVSVSGPKQYETEARPFFSRMAGGTQLYQVIHVDANQLKYEAYAANGELYDAFTLKKRPGRFNELIEQIPSSRESRRPVVPE